MKSLFVLLALAVTLPAQALDAVCETYLAAAAKTTQQPARQTVSDFDGQIVEAIVVNDVLYAKLGNKWKRIKSGFWADERKVVADMRSGEIKLENCKNLGSETVDGVATQVIGYTVTVPGTPPSAGKIYIGKKDGLVYANASPSVKTRYRYDGVTVPPL